MITTTLHFHTHLDEAQNDVWKMSRDVQLNFAVNGRNQRPIPRVGEEIIFSFWKCPDPIKGGKAEEFFYSLEVVSVGYLYDSEETTVKIELHIPKSIPKSHHCKSIAEWSKWFRKHRHNKEW